MARSVREALFALGKRLAERRPAPSDRATYRTGHGDTYISDGRDVHVRDQDGQPILHMEHADLDDIMRVLKHARG